MMRRFVPILGLLVWFACAGGPVRAASQAAAQETWQSRVARDQRVSFSPRTEILAGQVLDGEEALADQRAAAWLALGSVASTERRAELLEAARSAKEPERGGAILGLGEMGRGEGALLLTLAQDPDPALSTTALLALLRTRDPELRRTVEAIAANPADARAAQAAKLLAFAADPARSEPTPETERLLELRWRAGREFGLVDGQAWKMLVFRTIVERAVFRSDVVLRTAARIDRSGVRDLLLGQLLHGTGEARLRAAARGIPRQLAQLVQNGLWKPADLGEWGVLFDALEESRLEAYAPELFEAALADPALRARALLLYSRSGAQGLAPEIEAALAGASPAERVLLCRAMGESEDPAYLQRLGELATTDDPELRAAALVAQMLLGSRPADAAVRAALAEQASALRAAVQAELAANARSPVVLVLLETGFASAKEGEQRVLALALAREGVREGRAWCRKALLTEPPPPPEEAREIVGALRARLTSEDTPALRAFFPREDTPGNLALNTDLALALCELGDVWVNPLLIDALWEGEFEVSLLAGLLLVKASGLHTLRQEAANPPASARSTDLRRVGYALGIWGGLPEVEALAQALRYNSGAPALQGVLLGFLSLRTQ